MPSAETVQVTKLAPRISPLTSRLLGHLYHSATFDQEVFTHLRARCEVNCQNKKVVVTPLANVKANFGTYQVRMCDTSDQIKGKGDFLLPTSSP